jgi:hypothetical protein
MVVDVDPADFCYRRQCLSNNARPGSTRRRGRQFAGSALNATALRIDAMTNTALNADSQRDTIRGFAYDLFYGLQLGATLDGWKAKRLQFSSIAERTEECSQAARVPTLLFSHASLNRQNILPFAE